MQSSSLISADSSNGRTVANKNLINRKKSGEGQEGEKNAYGKEERNKRKLASYRL
jgi:hypothetical protein